MMEQRTEEWKVIGTDNYARESVADTLIQENMTEGEAKVLADQKNEDSKGSDMWYVAVPQSHRLSRGMEDLV